MNGEVDSAGQRPATASGHASAIDLARYWGAVVAWMAVISTLSTDAFSAANTNRYIDPLLRALFPGISVSDIFWAHTIVRKTAHFAEFFVLGVLVFWALRRGRAPRWRLAWTVQALAVAVTYAVLDELHQAFVPSRTAALADSGVDCVGAATSQAVLYLRALWLTRRV